MPEEVVGTWRKVVKTASGDETTTEYRIVVETDDKGRHVRTRKEKALADVLAWETVDEWESVVRDREVIA